MIKVTGKGGISATIVADSVSSVSGDRITTFELEYHRYVHSELMTHRCLVGETKLVFDLPSGGSGSNFRKYEMSVEDFYDKWVNGASARKASRFVKYNLQVIDTNKNYTAKEVSAILGMASPSNLRSHCRKGRIKVVNPLKGRSEDFIINGEDIVRFYSTPSENRYSLKNRLSKMLVRMLNEDTNEITHTTITDIWYVGEKETMTLTADKYSITTTPDHLILTEKGWKEMQNITTEDSIISCGFGVEGKKNPTDLKKINGEWVSKWNKQVLAEVSERQGGVCKNCQTSGNLEIHHILPVHSHKHLAFDKTNVVATCRDCHHNFYHKKQNWQASNKLLGKPVKVDSVVNNGVRAVYDLSVESDYHNFVANNIVVHNCFSRNAASSRAIPVKNMLELVRNSPAMPIHWGKNQAGMQAKEECDAPLGFDQELSNGWKSTNYLTRSVSWKTGADNAAMLAEKFSEAGYHKQIVNRLVEPFQMIKVVVTATSFDNFFWLRFHEDAQPEIATLARCMLVAYKRSKPQELNPGEWHLPYVHTERYEDGLKYYQQDNDGQMFFITTEQALKISASCCAQVSYRKGDNSLEKAEQVWERLVSSQPVHASPTEHQATPMKVPEDVGCHVWEKGTTHSGLDYKFWSNNFKGWIQHRALITGNVCNNYDYNQEIDITDLVVEEV